jgi:hypothetical protein
MSTPDPSQLPGYHPPVDTAAPEPNYNLKATPPKPAGGMPWWGQSLTRRWNATKRTKKHAEKAQKLYARAARLEARGMM